MERGRLGRIIWRKKFGEGPLQVIRVHDLLLKKVLSGKVSKKSQRGKKDGEKLE